MTPLDLSIPLELTLALVPDLVLIGGAMGLLLWAAWRPDSAAHQRSVGTLAVALCAITIAVILAWLPRYSTESAGPIALDTFRWVMGIVIMVGTGLAILLAIEDNEHEGIHVAEGHVLMLLAAGGMLLLVAARDMMVVFLGIELMSIASYALAGLNRRSARSAEGALKYFLLGAFSSAFLLYGMALLYGATGSTNLPEMGTVIAQLGLATSPLVLIGTAMLLIGFAFKVAAVPFHMWAPDVYEGTPSPTTAWMAATAKAAAFAAFVRVWLDVLPEVDSWRPVLAGLAIATMIMGNAIGLAQRSLKRLLAYSSIGHAGYLMVAVASGTRLGSSAMVFYLFIYTLATFGAFAVLTTVSQPGRGNVANDELAGLWKVRPWLAVGMGVTMLALLGFPFFGGAGFLAKWFILEAALSAPQPLTMLAVVLVLTTVISAGYYLRVVMIMFMRPRPDDAPVLRPTGPLTRAVLVTTVGSIFLLGLVPDMALRISRNARPTWGPFEFPSLISSAPPGTSMRTIPPPPPGGR
jgi:NADH-quinone oxidoreductase subunit N